MRSPSLRLVRPATSPVSLACFGSWKGQWGLCITDLEQKETVTIGRLRAALDPAVAQQALGADPKRHILAGNVTVVVVVQLDRRVRGKRDAKALPVESGAWRAHNGVQACVKRGNVAAAAGEVQVVVPGRVVQRLVQLRGMRFGSLSLGLWRFGALLLGGRDSLRMRGYAAAIL